MSMVLYHYWRSSSSWRVRWALALKGLQPEYFHVGLLDGQVDQEPHLSRNPMGFVPVLKIGERYLVESMAIIEWLEETYPQPTLFPGDCFQRQKIRSLCEFINAGIQPIQNLSVLDHVSEDPKKRKEWASHFIRNGFKAYEKSIQAVAGKFSFGNQVTAADLFLVPQCYNAMRFGVNLQKEFSMLYQIYENSLQTSACKASEPNQFAP